MLDLAQRLGGTWHPSLALVQSPPDAVRRVLATRGHRHRDPHCHGDPSLGCRLGVGRRVPPPGGGSPEALGGPQREMLDLFIDLYTLTGKAAWYRTAHPRGARLPPALVAAISEARPRWAPDIGPEVFLPPERSSSPLLSRRQLRAHRGAPA